MGIEPIPQEPESYTLSIKLRGQITIVNFLTATGGCGTIMLFFIRLKDHPAAAQGHRDPAMKPPAVKG